MAKRSLAVILFVALLPLPGDLKAGPQDCVATISPAEHPDQIPAQVQWEQFFTEVARPKSSLLLNTELNKDLVAELARVAGGATAKAMTARNNPDIAIRNREPIAIAEILRARDGLIRGQKPDEYRKLQALAEEHAKTRPYRVPVLGRPTVISAASGYVCKVVVKGKEHPELIPEAILWRELFFVYAELAKTYQLSIGQFEPRLIKGLQHDRLPMSADHINQFLQAALDAADEVEAARRRNATSVEVSAIVIEARNRLLRTFPESAWLSINNRALALRADIEFYFPSAPIH